MEGASVPVEIHLGPLKTSILNRQPKHRYTLIWEGFNLNDYFFVRRLTKLFGTFIKRLPREKYFIDMFVFKILTHTRYKIVDHTLVTA